MLQYFISHLNTRLISYTVVIVTLIGLKKLSRIVKHFRIKTLKKPSYFFILYYNLQLKITVIDF